MNRLKNLLSDKYTILSDFIILTVEVDCIFGQKIKIKDKTWKTSVEIVLHSFLDGVDTDAAFN